MFDLLLLLCGDEKKTNDEKEEKEKLREQTNETNNIKKIK